MSEIYGHKFHTLRVSTNFESLQKIAENENLTKKDYRVFIFLSCRLESKNIKKIDIEQTAATLNMVKKDVKESINNLIDEGIIIEGSDDHISKGYRMIYTGSRGKGTYDK